MTKKWQIAIIGIVIVIVALFGFSLVDVSRGEDVRASAALDASSVDLDGYARANSRQISAHTRNTRRNGGTTRAIWQRKMDGASASSSRSSAGQSPRNPPRPTQRANGAPIRSIWRTSRSAILLANGSSTMSVSAGAAPNSLARRLTPDTVSGWRTGRSWRKTKPPQS